MSELQLFSPDSPSLEPPDDLSATITVRGQRGPELARFLAAVEALGHLQMDVEVIVDAPEEEFVRTFYGWEFRVEQWR